MNDKKIWDFFLEKFNNPIGVASLMGNLYVESKLDPMYVEGSYRRKLGMTSEEYTKAVDNGTYSSLQFIHDNVGYGLVQWTYYTRKEGLYVYCVKNGFSIGLLDAQLEYIWQELQGYKTVLTALLNAIDIRETSDIVAKRYEKPQHTEEEYLQKRANYGQTFFEKFAGGEVMNTYKTVESKLSSWKSQGLSKPNIVVNLANACIGWPYVYGGRGEPCTPSSRGSRANPDYPTIVSKCQVLSKRRSNCSGCIWYPSDYVLFYDCRGFTYWCLLQGASIKIEGAGATSQYNNNSNWSEKGLIANMPRDKVCCVFRYDSDTGKMEHTLLYDGQGNYIHCSGEVKKVAMSKYKATHYAIPNGLYSVNPDVKPICTAKVTAPSGGTVNMRSKPNKDAPVVMRVPIGTTIDVYEQGADWCKVKCGDKSGYIMTQFLDFGDTPQPTGDTATVYAKSGQTVNMRSKPNKSASIGERVPIGKTVDVLEKGTDWCRVKYKDKTGYMMTEFLKF